VISDLYDTMVLDKSWPSPSSLAAVLLHSWYKEQFNTELWYGAVVMASVTFSPDSTETEDHLQVYCHGV